MTHFEELFGHVPSVQAFASGRVNLIGEHTDYNGGFVLPTAIPQQTRVSLRPRGDSKVRVASRQAHGIIAEYRLGEETKKDRWSDYIEGVTATLGKAHFPVHGFDAWIESEVPIGAGLSSSAALEVALIRALRKAFGFTLDDVAVARLCQKVENDFVGARVGIMDPMAASLADLGSALFLDTRSLTYTKVRLPMQHMEFTVINSGVRHSNVGGGYNQRRSECEQACYLLGIAQLRDLSIKDLPKLESLPEVLQRRARHVITENERVLDAVKALEAVDLKTLGRLFDESHASMRDDYEVSIPEIDLLVGEARKLPGVFGARLTGGGFGGSVVILCEQGASPRVGRLAATHYAEKSGKKPTVLVP